ncbi:PEPxxWA-CTERM sorting domain-containing protein [Massilia dura]|uniref:PEPxxWA-CTERM sorting domain-containing protein n=2 Tax=Pseudoduganella dura TaxID=321982 RepID=A0A6I3XBU5_9BURK|nr:PEPxxWA-CTERM sorting domain-containing protein [Pseudoduganella dura]
MELISTNGGNQYTIGLHGAETAALAVESDGAGGTDARWSYNRSRFNLEVTPGYFIHNLSLEVSYTGKIAAELPTPCTSSCEATDYAYSQANVGWAMTRGSTTTALPGGSVFYVDGTVTTRYVAPQSYVTDFDIALMMDAAVNARRTLLDVNDWGTPHYGTSTAELQMRDVRLIMTVSQVPEPATYAMLLAGLALVGAGVRRRRG